MKKLQLLIALLFHFLVAISQVQHEVDSLKTIINTSPDDTSKVQLYVRISRLKTGTTEYVESKQNADAALELSNKLNYKKGIADAYCEIGMVYWRLKENQMALDIHLKALPIYESLGIKASLSNIYKRIGHDYADLNKFQKSMEFFQKALALDEQLGDKAGISKNLNLIGYIYMNLSEYDKALDYYFESINIYKENSSESSIGGVYHDIGIVYAKQNKLAEALKYSKIGLDFSIASGSKPHIMEAYEGLEMIYLLMRDFQNAYNSRISKDSIAGQMNFSENAAKINQLQMQHDFEKKDELNKAEQKIKDAVAANKLQTQKYVRNIFIFGFLASMLFTIVFFMQRNRISKEKKRSEELLLNILPEETAEELKATGTAVAKDYNDVTVLFTDFKNFTSISEGLNAQELVNQINYCYSAFDAIISKYGVEKIKTIGDSYMCASGLPHPKSSHAIDAVSAALEIRAFVEQDKQKRLQAGLPIFEIRIGLNSGPVVAGIVGVKKFAYDIWGDTVNTASRMETNCEAGKVNISGSTYQLVKDKFNCTYRGKILVKGKGEIDMYFVEQSS